MNNTDYDKLTELCGWARNLTEQFASVDIEIFCYSTGDNKVELSFICNEYLKIKDKTLEEFIDKIPEIKQLITDIHQIKKRII